jgi:thiamine-phosphate pyrophosphorylase
MLRYAITSRALFPGDPRHQQAALVEQAARWASTGIDFIQLREKELPAADLAELARGILKNLSSTTKLLINSRPDIAIAVAAHGVHLPAAPGELTPGQVRQLYATASLPPPLITASCHTLAEVARARDNGVDAILFGPVFGKLIAGRVVSPPPALSESVAQLRAACTAAAPTAIFALGGVTLANAPACIESGAAGIAGIRLFHK